MPITTKPTTAGTTGTFTFVAHVGKKTGTSDPIPNNATMAQAITAFLQAYQRAGQTIPANKLAPAALTVIAAELAAARGATKK